MLATVSARTLGPSGCVRDATGRDVTEEKVLATPHRHRVSARLAVAGLIAGAFAFAAGPPAVAAEEEKILVYTGDSGVDQGYSRFGQAVGLPVEQNPTLPSDLSSYACIVLPINRTSFSPQTTNALVTYVNDGGNLLALGEAAGFLSSTPIDTMNALSAAVGASMSLTRQLLDIGIQVTTEIDPSPLTIGVSSIGYGSTTGVLIAVDGAAQSLVRTRAGGTAPRTTFVAAETIGAGTFVLSGDSNVFSDFLATPNFYADHDNGVLAKNLCLGSLQQPYSFEGFLGPVDNGVLNTVKGGATVPLQFRIFHGDTEITDPAVVQRPFTVTPVTCADADTPAEEVEFTTSGKTELRYTDGKFQQNWKTPRTKGCYQVTISTTDGATLTADFRLR
jgi:hypothetical protein